MLTADKVLDKYYLEVRCMLIEIAATLDRHDRALEERAGGGEKDERLEKVYEALVILSKPSSTPDRSERLLNMFSDLD
ncbi:MAG: hypothetical protein QF918_11065 [Pirellulaceae bacterium]|jgi:hypothetical protein|nr:hypothetical protein [Pirellulaceae bacterium]MDP6553192.1 hypothetical protein [Pirellulaceae bacterium]